MAIEIKKQGRLGSIARVMANFGFHDLVLINPGCSPKDQDARNRAKHAQEILENARIAKPSHLKSYEYLIATTASLGTDYNIPRSPITPEQLSQKLVEANAFNSDKKIGLVLGREATGLTNQEIKMCDFVVTIPSGKKYPTLNISHAPAILLYELAKVSGRKSVSSHIVPATKKEKDIILKLNKKILRKIHFPVESKRETQVMIWKRIIGKSFLSKREAFALIGYLKKVNEKMKES